MRYFDLLQLYHCFVLTIFQNGVLHTLEFEKRCVFDLIDLDAIIFDFPKLEKGILNRNVVTLTMSRLMRAR
jgi:hypothetical protein